MKGEERRVLLEFLQRVEVSLGRDLISAFERASPDVFWMHVRGLRGIAELTKILKDA